MPFLLLAASLLSDRPLPRADLTLGYTQIETLDGPMMQAHDDVQLGYALYEGLLTFDPETFEAVPGVAESHTISEDRKTIQSMTARLKAHLPQLVTIAMSAHRDVLDMVWLINHGQIFRFLRKPLSPGRCAVSLKAGLEHHQKLLRNPALVSRYTVEATDESDNSGIFSKLKMLRRLWARE